MNRKARRSRAGAGPVPGPSDPQPLLSDIERFLVACKRPAVLDYGDEAIDLVVGQYALEVSSRGLTLEAWNDHRSLSRRIIGITGRRTGVLDCCVQRFGGVTGKLTFLDLDRPQTAARSLKGQRQNFAEQFRRMLQRQYPSWEICHLSSAIDLRRSFSAIYPRAHLVLGNQNLAALAVPSPDDEPGALTAALLWHAALQQRFAQAGPVSLALFLPEQAGNMSAHRLRWLTRYALRVHLFRFNEHGMAGEIDPQDLGNLDTHVATRYLPISQGDEWEGTLAKLADVPGVGCCPQVNGRLSIRYRGLEFSRLENGRMLLGIESPQPVSPADGLRVIEYLHQLTGVTASRPTRGYSGLPCYAEQWLESVVRSHVRKLDPDLLEEPLHGQVLTFAGSDRDRLDLLGVSRTGRLTIIELKTAEDLQLPMQALDYWMRIGWHAERDELHHLFPGLKLSKQKPRLVLVAPALAFHPANEIVLRYFAPEIEVERIGLHSEWQSGLQVAFRLQGADLPISHQGAADDSRRADQYQEGDWDTESA